MKEHTASKVFSFYHIVELFEFLEKHINDVDEEGDTLLHIAVMNRSLPIVKFLTSFEDTDINIANHKGQTPIYLSKKENSQDILEFLLDNGAYL